MEWRTVLMNSHKYLFISVVSIVFLLAAVPAHATGEQPPSGTAQQPAIAVTEDMGGAMAKEATKVGEGFRQ